jgi:hypothetical protein
MRRIESLTLWFGVILAKLRDDAVAKIVFTLAAIAIAGLLALPRSEAPEKPQPDFVCLMLDLPEGEPADGARLWPACRNKAFDLAPDGSCQVPVAVGQTRINGWVKRGQRLIGTFSVELRSAETSYLVAVHPHPSRSGTR